jgi:5-methylcytosine-specific restriction endonuclease McrA
MQCDSKRLSAIYDRTGGYCHLCHKKLAFQNYASFGQRGAWEIEHSVPKARGGTDRLCNLYPACISCNRQKQHLSTRTARRWNGQTRAPLSADQRRKRKDENTLTGAGVGLLLGAPFGGLGAILGPMIGGYIGRNAKDK